MAVTSRSIQRHLLMWLLIPSVVLWALATAWVYFVSKDAANTAYDYNLRTVVDTIASRIKTEGDAVIISFPTEVITVLREYHVDDRFVQILGPHGEILAGDPTLKRLDRYPPSCEIIDGQIGKRRVRIAALGVPAPNGSGLVLIQVAETLKGREMIITRALNSLFFVSALALLLISAQTILGVRRGLRPLEEVRAAVASRTLADLQPIDEKSGPEEVRPLVSAINDLLRRLREDLEQQRRFVANAAHQLRTPLAGLRIQTELALRDPNLSSGGEVLAQLQRSVDRATNLANKLLSLARAEPGGFAVAPGATADLHLILQEVAREFVPRTLARNIDLGLEGHDVSVIVSGNHFALRELVVNLVENSVNHTPDGGVITLRVGTDDDGRPFLSVEDNGPGIPLHERERVFDRFFRGEQSRGDGSGLGLAIVREIATQHKATIAIDQPESGVGARIRVTFRAILTRQVPITVAHI